MKFPKASENGGFEKAPAGNHLAVCYEVIDLGTQEVEYQNEKKRQRKIWLSWELPNELMDDGRPYVIGKRYTLSSFERAKLRTDLESWRGCKFQDEDFGPEGKFDIKNVIGVGCFLNVVHSESNGRMYANIEAIAALPKGTVTPPLSNDRLYLSLEKEDFDPEAFMALSERMQDTIRKSPEYASCISDEREAATREAEQTLEETPF
jgi:hypothetical protein